MANNDREPKVRKRGRPVNRFSVKLFLLDPDNESTKVTKEICSRQAIIQLMQKGCGPPQPEHCTNPEKDKVEFLLELTNEEFKQKLVEIYPKLENACFVFMKANRKNNLEELDPGTCCYRCYTPENVYHSERGQGRLYIQKIPEDKILSCTHGISRMKRLRGTVGGSQLLYVPIQPKPAPTISASNSVGGESSKDVVMSVAMPTNSQLPASDMTGIDLRQLLCNTLDLSSSSIVVAQTKSTPTVQNSGNMVAQRPLSAVTFVDESRSPVGTSGNSTAQGPASATVSGTEKILSVHSSGNMVPRNQLPLSAIVSQTASTPAVHSSGNMVPQGQLPLPAAVPQTASLQSYVCATKQNQLQMLATVSQAASSQPFRTYINTVPQGQLAGNTLMSPFQFFGNMVGQDQLQTFGTTGVPDANIEQPILDTRSQITSWSSKQGVGELPAILEAPGTSQLADTYRHVNTNLLQATDTGFQVTNEDISDFNHPNIVSDSIATQPPNSYSGLEPSNMLNFLAEYAFALQENMDISESEKLRIDEFLENVKSTKKLKISLAVLDNDALLKKLNESTIKIDTVEIQSTCKVHQVLSHYPLPSCLEVLHINENNLSIEDILDLVRLLRGVNGLRELYLLGTKFEESSFFAFICVFNNCKDVRSLLLTDNGLTKEHITCLITAFKSLKNLENLTLSKSNLTETQANDILQKHGQCENIVSLDLSHNAIQGNEIIIGICQLQSLEELNLSHNYIRFFPLPNLEQKRDNLSENTKIISLASNNMTPYDIHLFCSLIRSDLQKLYLDFNHVDSSIWTFLSRIKHLKVLSLADTDICGAVDGLAILLSLVGKLEELNLSSNNLMAEEFRELKSPLSNLTQLKTLNLNNNPDGISALLQGILPSLKYLEELRLSNTHLNSDDLSKICASNASFRSVRYLDLSINAIGSDGLRALANILKEFLLLERLDMSRACIKEDDISVLCEGLVPLKKIKYLNLSGNRIDLEVLDDDLCLPSTLEELIFSDIITHGEKLFFKMKQLKNLRKLYLNQLRLRACDVEVLAAMLSSFLLLEDLSLTYIVVPFLKCETILNAIRSLGNIKKIDLSGIKLFDETALVDMLSSLSSLEELVLTDMNVVNMDYERFFSAIKLLIHLRKLNLGGVNVRGEKACRFDMLSSLSVLEEIVFPNVVLRDTDCMTGYFSSLESLRYMKSLDLHCTKIRKPDVEALARVLPSLPLLEQLVLRGIDFDDECEKQLFAAVGKLKYLKELNLCETPIIQTGAEALADVLPSLQLLEILDLGKVDFDDGGQKQLFAALGKLKYLKELNLRETRITQTGVEALVDVLPSLQLLEKLVLGRIDCDDGCQKQLFAAIKKELKYLKEFNLCGTYIIQTSAEAFADVPPSRQFPEELESVTNDIDGGCQKPRFSALRNSKHSKGLNLSETHITKTAVEALADVLSSPKLLKFLKEHNLCKTSFVQTGVPSLQLLEKLVLGEINCDDQCQKQLFAALEKLKYLKELNLRNTSITRTGVEALADVLPSLKLLEKLVLGEIDCDDECQKQVFAALGKLKYLKELNLLESHVTQTGAKALVDVLSTLQLLEKLVLGEIDINDECEKLFAALGKLKNLKELNLCEIHITETNVKVLDVVLPSLRLLEELHLGEISCDDECHKKLFDVLGKLKYLKKLNLVLAGITQTDVEALTDVLSSLQLLEKLLLGEVDSDGECQKQLFAALEKLKYLKEFSLCFTGITQTGAEALAHVLPSLDCLEKLGLPCILFENEGDQQLFTALRSLCFFKELSLGGTVVTETGAATLTSVLPTLRNLKRISLPWEIENDENGALRRELEEAANLVPGLIVDA